MPVSKAINKPFIGRYCLVRTAHAGIHVGFLAAKGGDEAHLNEARRIWRWSEANTPHEISMKGCSWGFTKISEPVKDILLTGVTEVIPCTKEAQENLRKSRWGEAAK